ncbi:uncharacterized protein TNCV_758401 [Trichonephila clavipes]|nr:uncharacterized protein TNCV_758401 [Trichonephila clavipes]
MISVQYFVDRLKYGQIQRAVPLEDVQDLKSDLLYSLKLQAANQASCRDRQSIRGAKVTLDAPCESSCMKDPPVGSLFSTHFICPRGPTVHREEEDPRHATVIIARIRRDTRERERMAFMTETKHI